MAALAFARVTHTAPRLDRAAYESLAPQTVAALGALGRAVADSGLDK